MAESAVPILPSRDLHETLAFYERLGFHNAGAPPEEWNYASGNLLRIGSDPAAR